VSEQGCRRGDRICTGRIRANRDGIEEVLLSRRSRWVIQAYYELLCAGRPFSEVLGEAKHLSLRYSRIEALPQLLNVLRGEMSIFDRDARSPSFLD
jgi:hypothetical protein